MEWINSGGGPLILISEKSYKKWSGTFKRELYLQNEFVHADNFLSSEEADYGEACSIRDYVGLIEVSGETAIVLGDEPLSTTAFKSSDNNTLVIARCYYTNKETLPKSILTSIDLVAIGPWTLDQKFEVQTETHFLFDSAFSGYTVDYDDVEKMQLTIRKGNYAIWTTEYSPTEDSKFLLHKFEITS